MTFLWAKGTKYCLAHVRSRGPLLYNNVDQKSDQTHLRCTTDKKLSPNSTSQQRKLVFLGLIQHGRTQFLLTNATTAVYCVTHCSYSLTGQRFEPPHGKTNNLHRRKQRRRSGNREADQRLCFRYSDSTISLLSKSKISSF